MARPRNFDEERVIAGAMEVFWERGFAGTSLDALEEATGLNRSSLYNSFGDKLQLFVGVLDAYHDGPCRSMEAPLRERAGADGLRGYLEVLRAFVVAPGSERGCMMVNTALEDVVDPDITRRVRAHFTGLRGQLRRAFEDGLADGTIDSPLTPEEGADWLLALVRGVLSGAASGEPPQRLERTLDATAKQLGLG